MQQKLLFLLASLALVVVPPLVPFPVLAFAPYLMWVLMHKPLKHLLWNSLLCGILVDCCQSSLPFGCSSLEYVVVAAALYQQKWLFFNDKPFSLSLFVTIFSLAISAIHTMLFALQGSPLSWSLSTILTDFVLMPLCDGFYAFIVFTVPLIIYQYSKKRGFRFLFMRKVH